jgi:hypothetical protein
MRLFEYNKITMTGSRRLYNRSPPNHPLAPYRLYRVCLDAGAVNSPGNERYFRAAQSLGAAH